MFNWREDATFFLYKSAEKEIYYQKRNGIVDIFVYYIQSGKQELWIQDGFLSCKILYQSANNENTPFCYVLLKDINGYGQIMEIISKEVLCTGLELGDGCVILSHNHFKGQKRFCYVLIEQANKYGIIMEIISNKVLLNNFKFNDKRSISHNAKGNRVDKFKTDSVIGFLNKTDNTFSLYSILEGFLFGPYNYSKIEEYKNGVILDNITAVENNGTIRDISGFCKNGNVFYNAKKDEYLLLIDKDEHLFVCMTYIDDEEVGAVSAVVGDDIYIYEWGELRCESRYDDEPYQWSAKDSWDAMTDGMYGDYQGDDDYDKFGF